MIVQKIIRCLTVTAMAAFYATSSQAETQADIQRALANPIADLASLPFQFNYDQNIGSSGQGSRWTLNVQPVIPFELGEWNLISRSIVPLVRQNDGSGASSQTGVGDIVQSFFLSPATIGSGGLVWGVGPVFLLPTATDKSLGADTWGAGLTAIALKQAGPWTFGFLANHLWDFSGPADINATYAQPFLSYGFSNGWTGTLQSEATYDWTTSSASVPVGLIVQKLSIINGRPVSFFGGLRYYVDSVPNGPSGLGLRAGVNFIFPKK